MIIYQSIAIQDDLEILLSCCCLVGFVSAFHAKVVNRENFRVTPTWISQGCFVCDEGDWSLLVIVGIEGRAHLIESFPIS